MNEPYDYEKQKHKLFTDKGQRLLLAVRDLVGKMLDTSGAVRVSELTDAVYTQIAGVDTREVHLALDRLVELGELKRVHDAILSQYDIYVRNTDR